MKKSTKNVWRVIISIIYIIWGALSPLLAIGALLALDVSALLSAGLGILMLLAGIFGLIGVKKSKCKIFAVIIFIFAVASAVFAFSVSSVITALLAWLFIICL